MYTVGVDVVAYLSLLALTVMLLCIVSAAAAVKALWRHDAVSGLAWSGVTLLAMALSTERLAMTKDLYISRRVSLYTLLDETFMPMIFAGLGMIAAATIIMSIRKIRKEHSPRAENS